MSRGAQGWLAQGLLQLVGTILNSGSVGGTHKNLTKIIGFLTKFHQFCQELWKLQSGNEGTF